MFRILGVSVTQASTSRTPPAEEGSNAATTSSSETSGAAAATPEVHPPQRTDQQRLAWLMGKPEYSGLLGLYQQLSDLAKDDKTRGQKGRYSSTSDQCCGNAGDGSALSSKKNTRTAILGVQRRAFVSHVMGNMKLTRVTEAQAGMIMSAYGSVHQLKFTGLLNYTNEQREQYFCGAFGKSMTICIAWCLLRTYIDNQMDGEDITKVVDLPFPVRVGDLGNFNPVQGVAPHDNPLTRGLMPSFRYSNN